jgi:hypothetical protein
MALLLPIDPNGKFGTFPPLGSFEKITPQLRSWEGVAFVVRAPAEASSIARLLHLNKSTSFSQAERIRRVQNRSLDRAQTNQANDPEHDTQALRALGYIRI